MILCGQETFITVRVASKRRGNGDYMKYTIPGLSPICLGMVMLLLGVRELNIYFKEKKSSVLAVLGIVMTLLFGFLLYLGIDQILTAVMNRLGM